MPFEATLFIPSPKSSSRVTVRAFGGSLEVSGGPQPLHVDPGKCEVTAGGWNGQATQIAWPGEGGTWAIFTEDPQARVELERISSLREALGEVSRAHKVARRNGRLGVATAVLITLLPVLALLAILMFRDRIVDAVLARIPITIDQEVGRMFEGETVGSKDALPENEATRAVRLIVDRLKAAGPGKRFEFKVSVQRKVQVNAFAAPGGLIVVYTGLIKEAGSAEELAGVLAHEMAHATNRHAMRQLIYAGGLLPLAGLLIGQPDAAALFQNLRQLSELKFSRTQEEDADRTGFDTLVAASISTEGMARFFDRLASAPGTPPSFLSTHPSSSDRAAAIRERTKALPGPSPEPLSIDWTAIQASLN